jgi:hypothetical protein
MLTQGKVVGNLRNFGLIDVISLRLGRRRRVDKRFVPSIVMRLPWASFTNFDNRAKCVGHMVNPGEFMTRNGGIEGLPEELVDGVGKGSSHGSKAIARFTGRTGRRVVSGEGVCKRCI